MGKRKGRGVQSGGADSLLNRLSRQRESAVLRNHGMNTAKVNNINQFNIAKSSARPLVTTFQDLSVEGKKAYHASSNLNFTARMEGRRMR
jgi:hypothetical protein